MTAFDNATEGRLRQLLDATPEMIASDSDRDRILAGWAWVKCSLVSCDVVAFEENARRLEERLARYRDKASAAKREKADEEAKALIEIPFFD